MARIVLPLASCIGALLDADVPGEAVEQLASEPLRRFLLDGLGLRLDPRIRDGIDIALEFLF